MQFTEAHFWLFVSLAFLLGVIAVIGSDFGKRSEIYERIEKIEKQLETLQSSKKGKIRNDKINLREEVERIKNSPNHPSKQL